MLREIFEPCLARPPRQKPDRVSPGGGRGAFLALSGAPFLGPLRGHPGPAIYHRKPLISLRFLLRVTDVLGRPRDHRAAGTETLDLLQHSVRVVDRSVLYYYPESVVLVRVYLYVDYYYLSLLERVPSLHEKILFLIAPKFIRKR